MNIKNLTLSQLRKEINKADLIQIIFPHEDHLIQQAFIRIGSSYSVISLNKENRAHCQSIIKLIKSLSSNGINYIFDGWCRD